MEEIFAITRIDSARIAVERARGQLQHILNDNRDELTEFQLDDIKEIESDLKGLMRSLGVIRSSIAQ